MKTFLKELSDKNTEAILTFTSEVMELRQCFHDDADEGQVQHGHSGLDLGVSVARVGVVAGEEVVNHADHFFVEAKHPTVTEGDRAAQYFSRSVGGTMDRQTNRAHNETKPHSRNSQLLPAYLAAAEVSIWRHQSRLPWRFYWLATQIHTLLLINWNKPPFISGTHLDTDTFISEPAEAPFALCILMLKSDIFADILFGLFDEQSAAPAVTRMCGSKHGVAYVPVFTLLCNQSQ